MSFPKAKNKRFNEFMSCAPPVGSYDPKTSEKVLAALMDSKDERFKEPKPVDSHASNLLSASVVNSHSFQASTPRKLSAASSTESLANDRSVSGIPKRATSTSNIMAPVDLAKQKELERQIRMLVNERNELRRRVLLREEELQKVDSRLQQALKDQTAMIANLAAKEKELADLKKGNEILKTKVHDFNVDRQRQLQTEVTHLQDKLKKKEREVADMHDKLKCETDERNSAVSALTQTNSKLADTNKALMKEIEDQSRQLRLLVGDGRTYEAEMDLLKKDISQLKSRNQVFISQLKSRNQRFSDEEATLVEQCDRVQLVFSHCLNLQKQMKNLVENITQQAIDSWTDASEELRVQLKSDISLLRTSMESCHMQKIDTDTLTGDLKLRVHELVDAAITDVDAIESVHLDLLSLFSKLIKCQQNEEALGQSVSMLNEKIKEHQENLNIITEKKGELQTLYEEALESVKTEKKRFENIQLTANGLLSEKMSLEMDLRNEKELSIGLQEKLRSTDAKISQLSETILSKEKLISCSTGDKEDLLQQNLGLESELRNATEERDRLEKELKGFDELSEVIHLKDSAYKQLEVERNELTVKLTAAGQELGEASQKLSAELGEARELVQRLEEERDRMMLEKKTCEEATAVVTAELTEAATQLEELKCRAAETKARLEEVLSDRDRLAEDNRTINLDLEKERDQSAGYEGQLMKREQESLQLREQLSLDAEEIISLEKALELLQAEMGKKCKDLEETLDILSQRKAELECSVKMLETELSGSQDSLSSTERRLHESESACVSLSCELESVKAEREEAENLLSRLQGEVQTVRLQMEQAEFARTELEVAKAYMESDLSEVNDKLNEAVREMEKVQRQSEEAEARNKQLNEDNAMSLAKVQGLEETIEQLNCFLVEANCATAGKEEVLQRSQEAQNDLTRQLGQQTTEINDLRLLHRESEDAIHILTMELNNYTSSLEEKTRELQSATEEVKVLLSRVNAAEELTKGFEAERARHSVEHQELTTCFEAERARLTLEHQELMKSLEAERAGHSVERQELTTCFEAECARLTLEHQELMKSLEAERERHLVERQELTTCFEAEHARLTLEHQELTKDFESERARHSVEHQELMKSLEAEHVRHSVERQELTTCFEAERARLTVEHQELMKSLEAERVRHANERQELTTCFEAERARLTLEHQELMKSLEAERARHAVERRELTTRLEVEHERHTVERQELATGVEAERERHAAERQELSHALADLRNNFDVTVGHLSQVHSEKDLLSNELNCVQGQMVALRHRNEELQQSLQLSLKSYTEERFQLSAQVETLSRTKKQVELEVIKCHDLIKRRNVELEAMSMQVKDLSQGALLVEKLKERCQLLESNSAKETEHLRQRLEEERRRVEMERHRQQTMQQDFRCNSDRLQMQVEAKTKELNEANERIRRLQKTHEQYSDQLAEMNHRHQEEMSELKRTMEEKSQQRGDITRMTEDANRWREMYEDLWNKVQPFKEQLEAFELEKQLLLGRSKNAQMEIEKLSHNYAKILGHQNQKQKIHHILKLKEENVTLKKDVEMLRDRESKQKRQIGQLNEKLDALEGKRRFDPSKAFKPGRESDVPPTVLPLREGNR